MLNMEEKGEWGQGGRNIEISNSKTDAQAKL